MEDTVEYGVRQAVEVHVPTYVVTMVCPLCHQEISWQTAGVTVCPHCGRSFVVKGQTVDGRR